MWMQVGKYSLSAKIFFFIPNPKCYKERDLVHIYIYINLYSFDDDLLKYFF